MVRQNLRGVKIGRRLPRHGGQFCTAKHTEGREYEPLTQRGARVHAVRQAKAVFAEIRERLELARDAWAEAREEGHGHVSAGLAALRAVAGRQAKELDRDEIKQRLARIAGRDLGADGTGHEAGADVIRDRLKQAIPTVLAVDSLGIPKVREL